MRKVIYRKKHLRYRNSLIAVDSFVSPSAIYHTSYMLERFGGGIIGETYCLLAFAANDEVLNRGQSLYIHSTSFNVGDRKHTSSATTAFVPKQL
jgi:hypothetical protein